VSSPRPLDAELRSIAVEIYNDRTMAGLAVGIVRAGGLEQFAGIGRADFESGRPVEPDTVFRIGSITKTMTAIAVMQLVEEGHLTLEDPVAEHLRTLRLGAPAGAPAVTIRHLLTHTGGLGELRSFADLLRPTIGLGVDLGKPVPSLADYYRAPLRADVPAGTKWAYANHGFALLGQLVEDVSGEPFAERLRSRLFEPLGMEQTDLSRSSRVRDGLAIGYALKRGRMNAVKDREIVVGPAGSVFSTTHDMALYAAALLGGGANPNGRVIGEESLEEMLTPQAGLEVGGAAMGLAFFLDRIDGHRLAGHDGGWPGFVSSCFVAPDDGVGAVAFTNTSVSFGPHDVVERVLRRLLGAEEDAAPVPERPDVWPELVGVYRPARGLNTNFRLWPVTGGEVEVTVRRGHLIAKAPSPLKQVRQGIRLRAASEAEPLELVAEIEGERLPVAFERGPSGDVVGVRVGSSLGGFFRLERRPRLTSIALWEKAAAGAAAAGVGAALLRKRRRVSSPR
jgi:CubicO group peptidase (beta-lactamase class C family)